MPKRTSMLYTLDRARFMDANGRPIKNGYIRFRDNLSAEIYDLPPIYATPDMDTALPNPLSLDYDGFVPISGVWLDITNNRKYSLDVMQKIGEQENPDTQELEPIFNVLWSMNNLPGFDIETMGNIYDTILGLDQIPDEDNATAIINGYYTHGDRGGGVFWWDAASTETEDRGIVFKPGSINNSQPGRWKRLITGSVLHSAFWGVYGKEESVGSNFANMQNWLASSTPTSPGNPPISHSIFTLVMNAGNKDANGEYITAKLGNANIDFSNIKVIWERGCVVDAYFSIALREDCELPRALAFNQSSSLTSGSVKCDLYLSNFNDVVTMDYIRLLMDQRATFVFDIPIKNNSVSFFRLDRQPQQMPQNTRFEVFLDGQPTLGKPTLKFSQKPQLLPATGINLYYIKVMQSEYFLKVIRLSDWTSNLEFEEPSIIDDSFDWTNVETLVCDVRCKIALKQPNLKLVASKPCVFENNVNLFDAKSEGGKLLRMYNSNYQITLNNPNLEVDGSMWASNSPIGSCIVAPYSTSIVKYTGRIENSNLFSFFGNIVFDHADFHGDYMEFSNSGISVTIRDTSITTSLGNSQSSFFTTANLFSLEMDNVAIPNTAIINHRESMRKFVLRKVTGSLIVNEYAVASRSRGLVIESCNFLSFNFINESPSTQPTTFFEKVKIAGSVFASLNLDDSGTGNQSRYNTYYDVFVVGNTIENITGPKIGNMRYFQPFTDNTEDLIDGTDSQNIKVNILSRMTVHGNKTSSGNSLPGTEYYFDDWISEQSYLVQNSKIIPPSICGVHIQRPYFTNATLEIESYYDGISSSNQNRSFIDGNTVVSKKYDSSFIFSISRNQMFVDFQTYVSTTNFQAALFGPNTQSTLSMINGKFAGRIYFTSKARDWQ